MAKKVYTSINIVELAKSGVKEIVLEAGDIVTPMARDTASEHGVQLIEQKAGLNAPKPKNTEEKISPKQTAENGDLEARVRAMVLAMLGENADSNHSSNQRCPIVHIDGRSVEMEPFPFEINRPQMDVKLKDVITAANGSPMGVGFMSLHKGSFPWTLTYDEIEYVIEGELHIGTPNGTVVGLPGDVLYIPKGTEITFGTPSWAKFLYVTYPAEWSG